MPTPISPALFERYLTGECSPEEQAHVQAALVRDPALALLEQGARGETHESGALWVRFRNSQHFSSVPSAPLRESPTRDLARAQPLLKRPARPLVYAAVVTTFLCVAIAIPAFLQHRSDALVVNTEYTTRTGETAAIQLIDGSHIVLGPETHARYARHSSGTQRVTLQGHARFTVTHDPATTFTVRVGTTTTRVLGTTFEVRHYASDPDVQIAVTEGRVASTGNGGSIVLAQGMTGRLTDSVSRIAAPGEAVTQWMHGRLVFTNTPVREMLATLERWYGVQFKLADSALATQRISTVLLIQRPNETLKVLQDMLDVSIAMHGNVITLRPASQTPPALRTKDTSSFSIQRGVGK